MFAFTLADTAFHLGPGGKQQGIAVPLRIIGTGLLFPDGCRIPRLMRIKGIQPKQERTLFIPTVDQPFARLTGHHAHIAVSVGLPALTEPQIAVDLFQQGGAGIVNKIAILVPHHARSGKVFGLQGRILGGILPGDVIHFMARTEFYIVKSPGVGILGQAHGGRIINEGGFDIAAPKHVGNGGIFSAQRLPPAKGKRKTACHDGTAYGNGRQTFAVGIFKQQALSSELVEIGRFHNGIPVTSQIIKLQCIQDNENDIFNRMTHNVPPYATIRLTFEKSMSYSSINGHSHHPLRATTMPPARKRSAMTSAKKRKDT